MRTHKGHHPALGKPRASSRARGIRGSYVVHYPANYAQNFRGFQHAIAIVSPHASRMEAIIIQRVADVGHFAAESDGGPELPIAAETQAFVRAAGFFVGGFTKNS